MTEAQSPSDLALWSLHCFCLKARSSPQWVIRLDNNGEILFSARGGTTRTDMRRAGTQFTESQLALLEAFGLIALDGEEITTVIPVLGPDAISVVRNSAVEVARRAFPTMAQTAAEIVAVLEWRGLEDSASAIVFGHALDGVFWDRLREVDSLPEIELTLDEPFWRGAFWAIYPGVAGSAGTNELTVGSSTLVMVWDDVGADALRELASHPATRDLLQSLEKDAAGLDLSEVLDADIVAPVITTDDEIRAISLALAGSVAEAMPDGAESQTLLAGVGVSASVEEANVILAHEVIWEAAASLARAGVIEPPRDPGVEGRVFIRIDT